MPELFNQPISSFDNNDRIAFGKPGVSGCKNLPIYAFRDAIVPMRIITHNFVEDTIGSYQYTAAQNELIIGISLKPEPSHPGRTIKIGKPGALEYFFPERSDPRFYQIFEFFNDANIENRVIEITASGTLSITILSILL